MKQTIWVSESRKTILCIDSYDQGILQGRFYGPNGEARSFSSLSRFLILMEEMLDQMNMPQSATTHRSFSGYLPQTASETGENSLRSGTLATFELQILFRHHASWQGMILWREHRREHSFRSALELIILLDSALREKKIQVAG